MDIIVIGYIALDATERTLNMKASELSDRFSLSYLDKARRACKDFVYDINTIADIVSKESDECSELIELSNTGIYGGLWKLSENLVKRSSDENDALYKSSEKGLKAIIEDIPVRQETIEILEYFDANPYTYPSKGTFLLACNNANKLMNALLANGIKASVIGITDSTNERVIINGETKRFLTPDDRLLKDEQDLVNNTKSLRKEIL